MQARGTGQGCSGRSRRACGVRAATCSPPRVAAFGTAACWAWHGNEAASTSLGVHLTALVRVHEGASRATPTSSRVKASLRGRALQCGCCWLVSHGLQRRRAAGGRTSVAVAFASACGGKTNRLNHRTFVWGRVGADGWWGGWGCGAHLDRGISVCRADLVRRSRAGHRTLSHRKALCTTDVPTMNGFPF